MQSLIIMLLSSNPLSWDINPLQLYLFDSFFFYFPAERYARYFVRYF